MGQQLSGYYRPQQYHHLNQPPLLSPRQANYGNIRHGGVSIQRNPIAYNQPSHMYRAPAPSVNRQHHQTVGGPNPLVPCSIAAGMPWQNQARTIPPAGSDEEQKLFYKLKSLQLKQWVMLSGLHLYSHTLLTLIQTKHSVVMLGDVEERNSLLVLYRMPVYLHEVIPLTFIPWTFDL